MVLRFAPNPNGPLSLGHSRGVVINNYYSKSNDGKIVLRFDDTDTVVKPPLLDAYEWIIDDFVWLTGTMPDVIIKASERMNVYLGYADDFYLKAMVMSANAPVRISSTTGVSKKDCPHRQRTVEDNLDLWARMRTGK